MSVNNVTSIIKSEISQLMKQRGLTITQLAQAANIGVATVHKIIQKDCDANITLNVLDKIAKALDISIESLLTNNKVNFQTSTVKLITWNDILDREKIDMSKTKQVSTHCELSDKAFSVKMLGNSMEPIFPNGTILIIDPVVEIYDGCFAMLNYENKAIFNQIIIDPPQIYATSLRSGLDNKKIISPNIVIGTLVESIMIHEQ